MKQKKRKQKKRKIVGFFILIGIMIYLIFFLLQKEIIVRESTNNIVVKNGEVKFSSLSLKQKICQMIIVRGDDVKNSDLTGLNIGGIFLDSQNSEEEYKNLISEYEKGSKLKLFIATDMEGAANPFSNFRAFPSFSEIKTKEEAFSTGFLEGELMKKLGFNLNFAPVSEHFDKSYHGRRAFIGTQKEIQEKISSYIQGLQMNVYGTCKHYPGKGMIKNLHVEMDKQNISKDDLELFDECFKNNISAVMVGHQIVSGEANSKGKPGSVSPEVIETIPSEKLIISDEINMNGLSLIYSDKADMYRDLINSGENIILDFDLNYEKLSKILDELEKRVSNGEISLEKIDSSARKILILKGYKVV